MNRSDILRNFRVSFFAMSRLSSFPWTFLERELENDKASGVISDILTQTCLHPLCQKHPPSVKYRRLFLTQLINRPCGETVSLSENVAVISEGTTGLVTWEAALCLAEWALHNQQNFTGRTVLELGSGVGLTGITVCRSCKPSRYVFTDCHPGVLQKLKANVRLNGLLDHSAPSVSVEELDWEAASEEQLREIGANMVIAADVVYDPDIIGCLVKLLSKILRCSSPDVLPEVLIASTIRNPDTYNCFKRQLENEGISHDVLTGPVGHVFPYNRNSTVEMVKLYI
ncbi:protein-lysine N-methyltransferase EEF2KMT isoform X2 [Lampris incognitus]|uniref:protein-lysine N-methyltransferase EEF2KMT isoform X2 n=1 Tax=Lampris incognitus TaxID=2546036 RepID=UPI0024B5623E|nr:protein-lysine N-methyltransferase EEF2KMT isoform X2 [Lampris incognitus]